MIVTPVDGQYRLAPRGYDGPIPEPRLETDGFGIEIHPDLVFIQCLHEDVWDGVELNIEVLPDPPYDPHEWDDDWDGRAEGAWRAVGPMVVSSSEDAEIGPFLDQAGDYELLVLARRRSPEECDPGEPREIHHVFVWTVG